MRSSSTLTRDSASRSACASRNGLDKPSQTGPRQSPSAECSAAAASRSWPAARSARARATFTLELVQIQGTGRQAQQIARIGPNQQAGRGVAGAIGLKYPA